LPIDRAIRFITACMVNGILIEIRAALNLGDEFIRIGNEIN
jgi:hypothetical protein